MDTAHSCFGLEALTMMIVEYTVLAVAMPYILEEARRFVNMLPPPSKPWNE
jgi:hypothetical protein